jgi:hypothetical protein
VWQELSTHVLPPISDVANKEAAVEQAVYSSC